MRLIKYPPETQWPELVRRPAIESSQLDETVRSILRDVRIQGDDALHRYSLAFDRTKINDLRVHESELKAAESKLPKELTTSILLAADNIQRFHKARIADDVKVETSPGVFCWTKRVPLQQVGIYIPGGTAPLFSTVLMLGIPAAIVGCPQVILCTPPNPDGSIHPAILFAARICGIKSIYRIGGAQAVAAMAYGTETVAPVDKIFGPGNQYVTKAKQLVNQEGIGIDFPAGPSEVMIIADGTARPEFIAADLLSQAEHGPDSQVMLVALDDQLIDAVQQSLKNQMEQLPRKGIASRSLENGYIIRLKDRSEAMRFANSYAPEHLILNTEDADQLAQEVIHAGSVFIGPWSPEAAGDYASGTNHTLPTSGFAKVYGGVSCQSFVKEITFQSITREGIHQLGPSVALMAEAEGLQGHKNAIDIRLAYEQ